MGMCGGASPPWAELPADALGEIAGHLHDAADFVRFHAVCRPWREAPPPPHPPRFLPCLVMSCASFQDPGVCLHSPFSEKIWYPPRFRAVTALRDKMLESSDAGGGRVLAVSHATGDRTAVLVNPLTGDATYLPPLPENICLSNVWRNTNGIVCNNGVVMLYTSRMGSLLAATMLPPGETDWEEVDVTCPVRLSDDEHTRLAATLCSSGVLPGGTLTMAELPPAKPERRRYVLESQGELLCLDVLDTEHVCQRQTVDSLMSVHALEVCDDGRPQWVERVNGRGTEQVCLFLNWWSCSGFAVDARELTGTEVTGGCAYFVGNWAAREKDHGVYRYSFKDGTATVVDDLPSLFDRTSIWYTPRPSISALRSRRAQ